MLDSENNHLQQLQRAIQTNRDRLERLEHDLYGNGNQHDSFVGRQGRMYRDLYHNSDTGEPGLIADVRRVRKLLEKGVTVIQVIAWLFATGLAMLALRWLGIMP